MKASGQSNGKPLQGQHAVVTGGGRGIGKAIVYELARFGAHLSLMGRDEAALAATAQELRTAHDVKVEAIAADLSVPQAIQTAFGASAQRLGAHSFADGYAQAVTFGLLMARAWGIAGLAGLHKVAESLKKSNTLIGTALQLLTDNADTRTALATSPGTLERVLEVVDWPKLSKGKTDSSTC